MPFCTKCGHKLLDDAVYCHKCGLHILPRKQKRKGSPRVEKLIQDLKDGSWKIKKHAVMELGKIGDSQAVEPLIEVLKKDRVLMSVEAAKSLGEIGGDKVMEALVTTLREDSRCYEQSEYNRPHKDDIYVALEAAQALRKIGEPALIPLIETLNEKYTMPRIYSSRTLETFGSKAVEPLIKALKNPELRMEVVRILGKIGDARAVKPLIEVLGDESEYVQFEAAGALNSIGSEKAEKAVKKWGKIQFLWPSVEKMTRTRDIEGLVKMLIQRKEPRWEVVQSLEKLGWEPRNDAEKIQYLIVKREWYSVAQLGEVALEPLIETLRDKDVFVRRGAVKALGLMRDVRVVDPLKQALNDEDSIVRDAAKEALVDIRLRMKSKDETNI